jgi:hypothetical protein
MSENLKLDGHLRQLQYALVPRSYKAVQVSFKLHCTIFRSTCSHKLADVLS